MLRFIFAFAMLCFLVLDVRASIAQQGDFKTLLQDNFKLIQRPSVKTISPLLTAIEAHPFPGKTTFLSALRNKEVWFRRADKMLFYAETKDKKTYQLIDIETGDVVATALKKELKQVKPNSGVRSLLDSAMVTFQLLHRDPVIRVQSLQTIERKPKKTHLGALRKAADKEADPVLKVAMDNLLALLTIQFGETPQMRVAAIKSFEGDLNLNVRAKLNPLIATKISFAEALPSDQNIARIIIPGKSPLSTINSNGLVDFFNSLTAQPAEISVDAAYAMLAEAGKAPAVLSAAERNKHLVAHVKDGKVAGIAVNELNTDATRARAYERLVSRGLVPPKIDKKQMQDLVENHVFFAAFIEQDKAVTGAAITTLRSIEQALIWSRAVDLALDAISLASIYFLAAIGLAITFGVMRVINMAHGEFIMMGAYSGYVVQQIITDYTLSIIVAIPVAFAVTFAAGVALERLVIRYLYNRPLETLLATFGVSIALQQLAKNIFGTQARPLTAPDWLDGALVINDVIAISWIRIAIFALGAIFFLGLWLTLNKTRLGLETRAVTQNPQMAASMGINPDRINMLTFGLGSGIAGIAGVAIGLYAKVTSELGSDYIVQSFMTVVIGGVGNIWGTLAGAGLIGILQKLIEDFNPSNTLAAQTYMIVFIIIFIQFRPRGLIALKGRAAEA